MSNATINASQPITDDSAFEPGDCRAVHLGEVRLEDGRIFKGVVLEFPAGPPILPISVIWDGTPLRLSVKSITTV
jgi:hypothetical protein